MHKLRTVRVSYLYIFLGSAFLSAAFLFVMKEMITWLYAHYSGRSDVFFVRLMNWVINHIGQTPSAIFLFIITFSGLYLFRSQKIADDLHALVVGSSEWVEKGTIQEIKVLSGGEIGRIAANLNRMPRVGASHREERLEQTEDIPAVALLIRTRAILRTLHEVEEVCGTEGLEVQPLLATANAEARSMERFLENLMIES